MTGPLSLIPPLADPADAVGPWWAVRLAELSERELELLSYGTAGRPPFEVRFNLEQLERERRALLAGAVGGQSVC